MFGLSSFNTCTASPRFLLLFGRQALDFDHICQNELNTQTDATFEVMG